MFNQILQKKGKKKLRNTIAQPIRFSTWPRDITCSLSSQISNPKERDIMWKLLPNIFSFEKAFEINYLNLLVSKLVKVESPLEQPNNVGQ